MDLMGSKSFLLSRAKPVVCSLSSVMFWSTWSRLLSPMQTPKPFIALQHDHFLGLKTLACIEAETPVLLKCQAVHSYGRVSKLSMAPPLPPPSPPPKTTSLPSSFLYEQPCQSFTTMDDLIGTDSGVHMFPTNSEDDEEEQMRRTHDAKRQNSSYSDSRISDKRKHDEECYPPPIPSLTHTTTGSFVRRTPWVWTRHYRDGKLVIEGRLRKRHEYLEARREDSRLILNLVSVGVEDDRDEDDHEGSEEVSEVNCVDDHFDHNKQDGGLSLESGSSSGITYSCSMFVDSLLLCSASNNASSSAPMLVRPVTSVVV